MKCYFELFLGENTILSTEILNNSQAAESLVELGENMGEQGNFFGSIDEKSNVNSVMSASSHWMLKI
ncbi:hypothetical protein [uncultured Aggregatibacter sp.]|uniref:hypothetical protein n=1 Tax=uncultured Aggregatibacter sp. TaxID=470564 RepID=UPI000395E48F|nr:hypothetical protein [uncultured Aggregatibacter sp.]ERH29323.1 hypothetical protein HMPREF9065_00050 [Aggregatibacter sp. oral taxon 458 str. W10330]